MTKSIQQLRDERDDHAKTYQNELDNWDSAKSETVTSDLAEKMGDLDAQIKAYERSVDLNAAGDRAIQDIADKNGVSVDEASAQAAQESDLFNAFVRNGYEGLTPEQHEYAQQRRRLAAEQSVGDPAKGGVLVPRDFSGKMIEKKKAFGGVRDVADVLQTTNGRAIDFATTDATSERGEWVGENSQANYEDATFGTKPLEAFKVSSNIVTVSWELLQDSGIPIEDHLTDRLSMRIARTENEGYTIGDGVGKPKGFMVAGSAGVTGVTVNGVTSDELVDIEHSLDPAYRKNATWQFNDQTLKTLKKLKDGEGRPIWRPGITGGDPDDIMGYAYGINQDVAEMAAGAKSIAFGDFSNYKIRDVMEVTLFRFEEYKFTSKGQIGFLAWGRTDGDLMDVAGESVKIFTNAAA